MDCPSSQRSSEMRSSLTSAGTYTLQRGCAISLKAQRDTPQSRKQSGFTYLRTKTMPSQTIDHKPRMAAQKVLHPPRRFICRWILY